MLSSCSSTLYSNSSTGEMTAADRAPPLDQQSSTGTQPDGKTTN